MSIGLTVGAVGIGGALTYLFDPASGNRRRRVMREALVRRLHRASRFLDASSRDVRNRTRGLVGKARYRVKGRKVEDDVLVRRVAAKIGRYFSHPRAIAVTAENGEVVLRGPVLTHEVKDAVDAVARIPGVKQVRDELEPHDEAGDIPALQGETQGPRARREMFRESWSPATRLLAGVIGGSLLADGLRRSALGGVAEGMLGALLLGRSVTNSPVKSLVGRGGRRGIDLQKTVTLPAPVDEVFDFFSSVSNYPRFMRNIREVQDLGAGRSHWVARGPAGIDVAWDAEIVRLAPRRILAWRSVEGSQIAQNGLIHFEDRGAAGTRVSIQMSYEPPAGALGHAVASLFGANPKKEMEEDLMRVKSFFETGKPAHDAARKYEGGIDSRQQVPR